MEHEATSTEVTSGRIEYYKIEIRVDVSQTSTEGRVDSNHKIDQVTAQLLSSDGELVGSYADNVFSCSSNDKYNDVIDLFTRLEL